MRVLYERFISVLKSLKWGFLWKNLLYFVMICNAMMMFVVRSSCSRGACRWSVGRSTFFLWSFLLMKTHMFCWQTPFDSSSSPAGRTRQSRSGPGTRSWTGWPSGRRRTRRSSSSAAGRCPRRRWRPSGRVKGLKARKRKQRRQNDVVLPNSKEQSKKWMNLRGLIHCTLWSLGDGW